MSDRQGRVARAVLSLTLLLVVIAGVPLLLTAMDLLPTVLPSLDQLRTALSTRDDGQLLRVVLAAVAWVCWFLFTAATVAEVAALVRARPAPSLRGLQSFQRPAAALVAAVVVGLTVGPSTAALVGADRPPLPAASADAGAERLERPTPSVQVAAAVSAPVALADLPRYEIQRRDTLWAIAETHLGDPLRYTEILQLNAGSVGPDNRIVPGAVLVLPADAVGLAAGSLAQADVTTTEPVQVMVKSGDTLWGISEAATGDGANWSAVWDANRGRVEPEEAVFDDPDVIRPGWTLTVPAVGEQAPSSTPSTPPVPLPAPSPQAPAGEAPTGEAPTAATAEAPVPASSGPQTATPRSSKESTASAGDADIAAPVVSVLGGGALLAGASLLALNRYRRRQFRHRRPGSRIPRTPAALLSMERELVTADPVDVLWLDNALRSLVHAPGADGLLPDVAAVSMTSDVLTLVLAVPSTSAPEPWRVHADGLRWSVLREARLPYDKSQRAQRFAPFPTLVSVGTTEAGEHWLVDLERIGILRIAGDIARGHDLLRFMAAELAHNTWSEMLAVTAVGLGAELAELNPDRLQVSEDGEEAIDHVVHRQTSRAQAIADGGDALVGRLRDEDADAWSPHVLLLAETADGGAVTSLLRELGRQRSRTGVAIVVVESDDGSDDGGWRLDIDRQGVGRIPALGIELSTHQLSAAEAAPLAQMLAMAAIITDPPLLQLDEVLPREDSESRSDDNETIGPLGPGAMTLDSLLPLSDSQYLQSAATTVRDVRLLAPATDVGRRDRAVEADPTLDRDLTQWTDETCTRPKLTLLGPVSVRAQGSLPERNPRRQFYTEVVAYLATRPGGATSEQYATAIWPDEPDVVGKTKVRQAISVVRAWLGTAPDGTDYLPSGLTAAAGGRYRITDALVDADLFRRLRARGTARGVEGIADLRAALGLVTGRPLDLPAQRTRAAGGYGWLVDDADRLDHELAAAVVDVAHVVATFHLGSGEPERAAAAAQVALRAGSFEDVPLLDLVAACDALGNRAEADAFVSRILHNHDAEVEEDLPPRTAEILFRRQRP